jgi:thymidylate kinase
VKPKIIVLMGLDGSGKTTQAELVAQLLNGRGIRSRVVWMRGESYLTRPVLRVGKALLRAPGAAKRGDGIKAGGRYDDYVTSKRSMFSNRLLRSVWRTLTILDLLISIRKAFSKLPGGTRVVLMDRYIYDTFIDIDTAFGAGGAEVDRLLGSRLIKIFPKPEKVILLEVTPEEAMRRKDDIPSVDYLTERRGLYKRVAWTVGASKIDGSLPIEEINSELMTEIKGVLDWARS